MALLQLIVMISMTVILNLQHSRTLQQSKQRSRSDFKFMNTLELIAAMIIFFMMMPIFFSLLMWFHWWQCFRSWHTRWSLGPCRRPPWQSKNHYLAQLQHQKHYCKNYNNSVINKIIAKSKRANDWPWRGACINTTITNQFTLITKNMIKERCRANLGVCMGTCTEIPPACAL